MQKYKFTTLAIALYILPVGASATQISPDNSTESKPAIAPQLAQHQHRKRYGAEDEINKMLQQLNLSNNQYQQIKTIEQKFGNKNKNIRQQVQNNRQRMRLLLATNASDEELKKQYQATKSLLQKLSSDRFEMRLKIMKVLTPRQKGQLAELIER